MRILVSADDLGLTKGITDGILLAHREGVLSSTSVLAGGEAFDYAMEQWRSRPTLALTAHLNLMEGPSSAPARDVDLLVDARGEMALSFVQLLGLSLKLRGAARERLRGQIRDELDAQLHAVAAAAGPQWQPRVDGHQHYHLIPIVLEALLELHERWNFSWVRVTDEPFFLARPLAPALPNYLGPNLAKHGILKVLSRRAKKELARKGIPHCRWFVGLLFSGQMMIDPVRCAIAHLEGLPSTALGPDDIVEILLHPGRAGDSEAGRWGTRHDLRDYYVSPWRDRERATLCSPEFRSAVATHLFLPAAGAAT